MDAHFLIKQEKTKSILQMKPVRAQEFNPQMGVAFTERVD